VRWNCYPTPKPCGKKYRRNKRHNHKNEVKNEKKHQKIESEIHVGRNGDDHGRFGLGLPVPVGIFAPKITFLSFLRKKAGSHTP
jgi:hypothetical protein